jgi:hypothetical protein
MDQPGVRTMTDDTEVFDGEEAQKKARWMQEVAKDSLNWTILYRDPASGTLWKRWLPWPSSHGGGPPRLERIDRHQALLEFDIIEEDLE